MRVALLLLLVLGLLLVTVAEPLAPSAGIELPATPLGRGTPVTITARDRGRGLAWVETRLVAPDGTATLLARQDFPVTSWLGSGVHEASLAVSAETAGVPEGPATIEVWARDHSWFPRLGRRPAASASVVVDLTPPRLAPTSDRLTLSIGGTAVAVYRVGDDAVTSGVRVGEHVFPGTAGHFVDAALRVALFTVTPQAAEARPEAFARDAAGNERVVPLDARVRARTFRERTLEISDGFLERKVPPLLEEGGLLPAADLLAGYLTINRDLRARTETRLRTLCRESLPRQLWRGAFLRLPKAASLSLFGDRRSYRYGGEIVDRQTHLGYDLASLRAASVPAANAGRVVHAGPLGIYGESVVLDHGLGVFSLYGHLSAISVATGTTVARGEEVGRTGDTGLAGGDHLHFSTMLHGIHVDPREWWDAGWLRDHVRPRLDAAPVAVP